MATIHSLVADESLLSFNGYMMQDVAILESLYTHLQTVGVGSRLCTSDILCNS